MDIRQDTSPEAAIKAAYDFAKTLRMSGAEEPEFPELVARWIAPFEASALVPYLRGGFTAGFHFRPLPWKRDIEAVVSTISG